ncbi:MAG: hypothetical protein JSW55_19995 [Chloroflexota bacterium]|nr:MAG: hypothetical protein JSW55_19995 [Chloroflexota bacterium]
MYPKRLSPKRLSNKQLFVTLLLLLLVWSSSHAVASDFSDANFGDANFGDAHFGAVAWSVPKTSLEHVQQEPAPSPTAPASEALSRQDWFVVDQGSRWTAQEMLAVRQIMDHTWRALAGVGLDGRQLLAGYRFVRLQAEFVPGEERLLAIVDHQKMEIVLADGAFKRLHGFYIYHELGHAVDHRLGRLPSEGYHQVAGAAQAGARSSESSSWQTKDGFWLRYPGRDDREEATADAFAWWVMDQAGRPQPFFPGTPPATDYADISRAIEDALWAVPSANS